MTLKSFALIFVFVVLGTGHVVITNTRKMETADPQHGILPDIPDIPHHHARSINLHVRSPHMDGLSYTESQTNISTERDVLIAEVFLQHAQPVSFPMSSASHMDEFSRTGGQENKLEQTAAITNPVMAMFFSVVVLALVVIGGNWLAAFVDAPRCAPTGISEGPPASSGMFEVVMLMLVTFSSYFAEAIAVPFLPTQYSRLGLSAIDAGISLSSQPFAVILFCPAVPSLSRSYGRGTVLSVGVLLQCAASFVFGFADVITAQHASAAYAIYLTARIFNGFGTAASTTTILAIVGDARPGDFAFLMGLNEMVSGIAVATAPVVGNFLYFAAGFSTTMMVAALLQLVVFILALTLQSSPRTCLWQTGDSERDPDQANSFGIFRVMNLAVFLPMAGIFLNMFIFFQLQSTLEAYIIDVCDLGVARAAVIFAVWATVYVISSPPAGIIAQHYGDANVIIVGALISGGTTIMLSSSFGNADADIRTEYIAAVLGLQSVGMPMFAVPVMSAMEEGLEEKGSDALDNIAALFTLALQFGMGLGSLLGNPMVDAYGFPEASAIIGVVALAYGSVYLLYKAVNYKRTEAAG